MLPHASRRRRPKKSVPTAAAAARTRRTFFTGSPPLRRRRAASVERRPGPPGRGRARRTGRRTRRLDHDRRAARVPLLSGGLLELREVGSQKLLVVGMERPLPRDGEDLPRGRGELANRRTGFRRHFVDGVPPHRPDDDRGVHPDAVAFNRAEVPAQLGEGAGREHAANDATSTQRIRGRSGTTSTATPFDGTRWQDHDLRQGTGSGILSQYN